MTVKYNTLVISDIHLGEDLSLSAKTASTRHLEVTERQLVGFLRYYSRRRQDGLPWRLVVNGDMVDFLAICVRPGDDGDFDARDVTPEELDYGLGRRPRVARAKVAAVMERHECVFRAMARFIAAGNRVDIIAGNHDVEFQWETVQEGFKSGLARIWNQMGASARSRAMSAEVLVARVAFHPWFFYEKGVAWIEHGHQYDECCSFDNGLQPVGPDGKHIATNVNAATLRYLTNRFDDVEPHSLQEWNLFGYLRFTFGLGLRGAGLMFKSYWLYVVALLSVWRAQARPTRANRALRKVHRERLRHLGRQWSVSEDTLSTVDQLRRRPVVANLRRLLSVLMVDRLVINILALLAIIFVLFALPFLSALVTVGGIVVATQVMVRLAGNSSVNPEAALEVVSSRIMRHVDARFVVLSHTHEPVSEALEDGRRYLNTGTWMATGRPGLLRSFTHVVIRNGRQGPNASLRQWRDGASRAFTPGWSPNLSVATKPEPEPEAVAIDAQQAA